MKCSGPNSASFVCMFHPTGIFFLPSSDFWKEQSRHSGSMPFSSISNTSRKRGYTSVKNGLERNFPSTETVCALSNLREASFHSSSHWPENGRWNARTRPSPDPFATRDHNRRERRRINTAHDPNWQSEPGIYLSQSETKRFERGNLSQSKLFWKKMENTRLKRDKGNIWSLDFAFGNRNGR